MSEPMNEVFGEQQPPSVIVASAAVATGVDSVAAGVDAVAAGVDSVAAVDSMDSVDSVDSVDAGMDAVAAVVDSVAAGTGVEHIIKMSCDVFQPLKTALHAHLQGVDPYRLSKQNEDAVIECMGLHLIEQGLDDACQRAVGRVISTVNRNPNVLRMMPKTPAEMKSVMEVVVNDMVQEVCASEPVIDKVALVAGVEKLFPDANGMACSSNGREWHSCGVVLGTKNFECEKSEDGNYYFPCLPLGADSELTDEDYEFKSLEKLSQNGSGWSVFDDRRGKEFKCGMNGKISYPGTLEGDQGCLSLTERLEAKPAMFLGPRTVMNWLHECQILHDSALDRTPIDVLKKVRDLKGVVQLLPVKLSESMSDGNDPSPVLDFHLIPRLGGKLCVKDENRSVWWPGVVVGGLNVHAEGGFRMSGALENMKDRKWTLTCVSMDTVGGDQMSPLIETILNGTISSAKLPATPPKVVKTVVLQSIMHHKKPLILPEEPADDEDDAAKDVYERAKAAFDTVFRYLRGQAQYVKFNNTLDWVKNNLNEIDQRSVVWEVFSILSDVLSREKGCINRDSFMYRLIVEPFVEGIEACHEMESCEFLLSEDAEDGIPKITGKHGDEEVGTKKAVREANAFIEQILGSKGRDLGWELGFESAWDHYYPASSPEGTFFRWMNGVNDNKQELTVDHSSVSLKWMFKNMSRVPAFCVAEKKKGTLRPFVGHDMTSPFATSGWRHDVDDAALERAGRVTINVQSLSDQSDTNSRLQGCQFATPAECVRRFVQDRLLMGIINVRVGALFDERDRLLGEVQKHEDEYERRRAAFEAKDRRVDELEETVDKLRKQIRESESSDAVRALRGELTEAVSQRDTGIAEANEAAADVNDAAADKDEATTKLNQHEEKIAEEEKKKAEAEEQLRVDKENALSESRVPVSRVRPNAPQIQRSPICTRNNSKRAREEASEEASEEAEKQPARRSRRLNPNE